MDIDAAIDMHRASLLRLLAGMFAAVGIEEGGSVEVVQRHIRLMILRLLGAAESATRRLIFLKARHLPDADYQRGQGRSKGKGAARGKGGSKSLAFPLFDKRKRQQTAQRRYAKGPGPRISFFDDSDRRYPRPEPEPEPSYDDEVSAERLCRRLNALAQALGNLDKQAQRLKRAEARRKTLKRLAGQGVVRINTPPGHRMKGRSTAERDVDDVLNECQTLVRRWIAAPDTS